MNLCWIQLLCVLHYTASGFLLSRYLGPQKCKADEEEPWSYRGKNGPRYWGQRYPTCNGQEQSPIDINTYNIVFNNTLPKLSMYNYEFPLTRATIENNGHSIQVTPADGVERVIFVNDDTYRLTQFHFHWGDTSDRGAEHTINGVQYTMELHFVHMNDRRQVAVIGVFFQEQNKQNSGLQNIVYQLPKVMYKGTRTELNSALNLNKLLPANPSSYFRYQGSLTTPGCAESVTWSVLTLPLSVGKDQMKEFRKLYSAKKSDATKNCKLSDNYRPVQPVNRRIVYLSQ